MDYKEKYTGPKKKMYEKQCLRCQKAFLFSKDVTPEPHLCPECDKFFKDFNSQEKRIHKIIPRKVTENVTPAPIITCPNIPPILIERIEKKIKEEEKKS